MDVQLMSNKASTAMGWSHYVTLIVTCCTKVVVFTSCTLQEMIRTENDCMKFNICTKYL